MVTPFRKAQDAVIETTETIRDSSTTLLIVAGVAVVLAAVALAVAVSARSK